MCAIVGSYKTTIDMPMALETLKHRGPDFQNSVLRGDFNIGHCRLSIMDVSSLGHQPYEKDQSILSFNGEIWNYNEIKKEYNIQCKSSSDTEVLINILNLKGLEALDIIDGMYAFAYITDDLKILVRDKIGEVPLFYVLPETGGILWSSEKKALIQYTKNPKEIIQFPAGHYYDFDKEEFIRFYNFPALTDRKSTPEDIKNLVSKAVEKRLHSDVPVAILVSGGLDSSIIAREVKDRMNVQAYTAIFDDSSDDLENARKICKDFDIPLKEVYIDGPDLSKIKDAVYDIETNMKTQIEIAILCDKLAKTISDDGYKVILSGEGADEVFGGYGNTNIKYSKSDDAQYRQVKIDLVEKMSRGNFLRGNLIFLKYGVEIRLPFVDMDLVDYVIPLTKDESKINKRLLKDAYLDVIPNYIVKRLKKTFQGEAGIPDYIVQNVIQEGDSSIKLYNRLYKEVFQNNALSDW